METMIPNILNQPIHTAIANWVVIRLSKNLIYLIKSAGIKSNQDQIFVLFGYVQDVYGFTSCHSNKKPRIGIKRKV